MEMKFETIKRKAVQEFHNRVSQTCLGSDGAPFMALLAQCEEFSLPGGRKPRLAPAILKEWEDYGVSLINEWDVRNVGHLIECFPSCVPAHWKDRKLRAYMADNENCDWMVAAMEAA